MSIATAFEQPPRWYDNEGQIPRASKLNLLRDNTGIIDQMSYRRLPSFDGLGSIGTGTFQDYVPGGAQASSYNPRIWKGFFQFRTGMTTLRCEGYAGNTGSERIKVFFDVQGQSVADIAATGTWGVDISLSSLGLVDGQVVRIEIFVTGTRPANAWYIPGAVYATPFVYSASWPGLPTFTTQWARGDYLTQLGNAITWCYHRMGQVPRTARRILRYQNGPFLAPNRNASAFGATHGAYPLYYGGVQRSYTQDILRIYGQVINRTSTDLRWYVFLNGTSVYNSGALGPGTHAINVPISLTSPVNVSVGSRARLSITAGVADAGSGTPDQSKWTFTAIRAEEDASGYPYATLPIPFPADFISPTDARDRLNALCAVVQNVKNRIDGTPWIWNRVYAMRHWYGYDDNSRGVQDLRARPVLSRQGSRLTVRGRGVSLNWGPISIPTVEDGEPEDQYSFSQKKDVIDSDKDATKTLYLDTVENLQPATLYEVWGDVQWAAETY